MSDSNKIPVVKVADLDGYKRLFVELMHSIAKQCDCSVTYNEKTHQILYKGPKRDIEYVINETAKILDISPDKFKTMVIKDEGE